MSTISIPSFSAVRQQPVAKKTLVLRRRFIRQVAILAAVGIVFSLIYVWIRVRVIQLGYEVSRIRKEVSVLKEEKSKLEADVASLKVPSRLESIAQERFGMRLPLSNEIVFVDEK